jgi:hypothetical protein
MSRARIARASESEPPDLGYAIVTPTSGRAYTCPGPWHSLPPSSLYRSAREFGPLFLAAASPARLFRSHASEARSDSYRRLSPLTKRRLLKIIRCSCWAAPRHSIVRGWPRTRAPPNPLLTLAAKRRCRSKRSSPINDAPPHIFHPHLTPPHSSSLTRLLSCTLSRVL